MPGARGDGNRHRGGRSPRRPVRPTARRLPEPERAVPRGSLPLQQGGRRPRSPRLPDGGKTQRLVCPVTATPRTPRLARLQLKGRKSLKSMPGCPQKRLLCKFPKKNACGVRGGELHTHSFVQKKVISGAAVAGGRKEADAAATAPQSKRRIKRGTLHIQQQQNKTKKNERKERGCERARGEERPVPDVAGKRRRCRQPRPGIAPARNDSPTRDHRSGGKTDGPSGVRSLRVSPRAGAQGGPGPGVRPVGARGCPPELAALLPARRPGCPGARVTPPSATRGI
ncbi:uncharacterized protein LOC121087159 [Falco naumanni]|uniref:uncharacterized protein LOC121087159 n=1 Tax=Falco naumanni TaxID=148594 RepID=UPI001ADE7182|nr:uncharacterized protein LOC121087159 [Falco naumanni]